MISEAAELLRRYATDHSEAAFTELIQRHVETGSAVGVASL